MRKQEYRIVIDDSKIYPQEEYPGDKWANVARLAAEGRWDAKLESRLISPFRENDPYWFDGCLRLGSSKVTPWQVIAHVPIRDRVIGGIIG